jgi:hypothetical protein
MTSPDLTAIPKTLVASIADATKTDNLKRNGNPKRQR